MNNFDKNKIILSLKFAVSLLQVVDICIAIFVNLALNFGF